MLKVVGLTKYFGGVGAVNDASFELAPQTITALIGPNGAGKTTLLNLITGVIPPSAGRIFFKGEDITRRPIHERVRKGIGKSFQIVSLFNGLTTREHMLIAITKNCMKHRYSEQEIEILNDTLATINMVNERGILAEALPASEQRRLDVGLLFALNSELLLLDEPFAGLAGVQVGELGGFILQAARGKTILMIEHRIDIAMSLASRILVMAQGKLISDGTPDEIKQSRVVERAYLGETD